MRISSRPHFPVASKLIFILATGLAVAASAADWNDHVGLQLDSFGSKMRNDMPAALEQVHDYGFKYVELVGDYDTAADALKKEIQSHQLTAVSAHFPYARFRDDPEGIANEAEKLGLKMVGCPSLPQRDKLDLAGCREAIAIFNHAGEVLAKHNIPFFYHPHGYEFKTYGDGTFFDLLARETKPEFVHFQMDIFWIIHAGQDPLKLFEKYGNRWISMHLKDLRKGARTGILNSHADKPDFVPIGTGQIDFTTILPAARKVGIKWFFIEDESAAMESSIRQSVEYLRKMPW